MPDSILSDQKSLRRAFGTFATGVTVVTTGDPVPHAMTANSFASVSLDPALVLVCVDRCAVMHRCLSMAGRFGVNVLASHQEAEARHFADRSRSLGAAQFEHVDWLPGSLTGAPLLSGALARFECELTAAHDGGDHTIFLGKVLWLDQRPDREPLVVFRSGFRQITPERVEVTA
ncbi:oxidoreductase [Sphaerimonospora thailandensis]|uniref:Oxidoreductase n=1 Tax=Sphaerimonospora thailandensis TaxID=795644 RepID=A0A8J3VXF1_9ACTN|nr:oxidoreductase [Sphaerimonospora thailandensis]